VTDGTGRLIAGGAAQSCVREPGRPASSPLPPRRRTSKARRQHLTTAMLLTPPTLYFLALFVVPLLVLLLYSFYTYENFSFVSKLTLANYTQALTSPALRIFYFRTLKIALVVSITVVVVSYLFAHILMYVLPGAKRILYFLVLVSLFGGYLVRIYAWRTMLGRNGALNGLLISAHLTDHPLSFLLNSNFAIAVALLNFLIPLGVLPIFSAMQNISPRLLEAAQDLGASRLRTARTIVLPLTTRGIRAAFAFCFIATMAEWVTPQLLGGPLDQFVGNQILYEFGETLNWPLGAAIALTLIASVVAGLAILFALLRLVTR
jgi:ABC-type spermidine/putrescine transport system permease subunit I